MTTCKWCGKKLGAKFDRICKDCGHQMHTHPVHWSSARQTCIVADCKCAASQPSNSVSKSPQFPRKRVGFGLEARNLFCAATCAVHWAHKHAKLEVV